jgi:anti-sigma regulatory factor (Ser/Thr protein kinase)
VPCARLHTRQILRQWQLGHLADDAEFLASELLANAVQASRPPVGTGLMALRLLANHEQLVIEVWDQNPGHPQPRPADAHAESGRGLAVIEALSHQWGSRRVSSSFKAVWCQLLTRSGQPSTESPPARPCDKRSGG